MRLLTLIWVQVNAAFFIFMLKKHHKTVIMSFFFYIFLSFSGDPDLFCRGPFSPRRSGSHHPHLRGGAARSPHALPSYLRPHDLHACRLHSLSQQRIRPAASLHLCPSATRRHQLPATQLLSPWGVFPHIFGDNVIIIALHRPSTISFCCAFTLDSPLLRVFAN